MKTKPMERARHRAKIRRVQIRYRLYSRAMLCSLLGPTLTESDFKRVAGIR